MKQLLMLLLCLLSEVDVITIDQVDSSPLGLHFISILLVHIAANYAHTVELCLMNIMGNSDSPDSPSIPFNS